METRQLGHNGPHLTVIGFGAWAIGGAWDFGWGSVDDNESIRAIQCALDNGVNWIDTAPVYGLGHSETVVERAVRGKRNNVFIATKCGLVWDDQNRVTNNLNPESIRREIDLSLQRLRTDHIDLYQFHWPDPETPVEDSWRVMKDLQDEGKVRNIGVCNFGVEGLTTCSSIARVQSLQPIYNLLERKVEFEAFPYCRAEGIGIVAYSPLQSGLLTGTFDINSVADDDWRKTHSSKFRGERFQRGLKIVEQLRPIAARYNKTVGQLAIRWVLMNPTVTSAIVGTRRESQVMQNLGALGWTITSEDMASIASLLGE